MLFCLPSQKRSGNETLTEASGASSVMPKPALIFMKTFFRRTTPRPSSTIPVVVEDPGIATSFLLTSSSNSNLKEADAQIYLAKSTDHEQFSIIFKKDNILKTTDVENKKIFTSYDAETEELKLHGIDILYDLQNVAIYNTLGQQIKTYKSLDINTINLSEFNDGIYFLELNIENTKSTKSIKFIKY